MKNLSGRLLIASPHLTDGNFLRSVVLIIQHDDDGAFGLVLNRPTEQRFQQLIEMTSTTTAGKTPTPRQDDWIYSGGPVGGPLLAIHDLAGVGEPVGMKRPTDANGEDVDQFVLHENPQEPWGSMSIQLPNPPAWITGDEDHLRLLQTRSDVQLRYITDYSGWGGGQLEHEMKLGGWLTCVATTELVFADVDHVWQTCLDQCGRDIFGSTVPGMHTVSSMVN